MNTADLLTLCARPRGFRTTELDAADRPRADEYLRDLLRQGRVHKAKISHKCVYWFADKDAALRAADTANASRAYKQPARAVQRPAFDPAAPMIITERTKVTRCPPFAPRFQAVGAIEFGLQRGRVTR